MPEIGTPTSTHSIRAAPLGSILYCSDKKGNSLAFFPPVFKFDVLSSSLRIGDGLMSLLVFVAMLCSFTHAATLD